MVSALWLSWRIIGAGQLFRRDRVIFWFLAQVALADIVYGVSYSIAEDRDAYYLPAFLGVDDRWRHLAYDG